MRRMNSMLLGHQGASLRTTRMYLSMASRVADLPGQGQVHDAAGDVGSCWWAEIAPRRLQLGQQALAGQHPRIEVNLQRADARVKSRCRAAPACDSLHQGMRPEAQTKSSSSGPYSTSRYSSPERR